LRTIETAEPDVEIERKLGKDGCWWLDVSCPSWEDLRDLGEVRRAVDRVHFHSALTNSAIDSCFTCIR
jgi:hypothetical protein